MQRSNSEWEIVLPRTMGSTIESTSPRTWEVPLPGTLGLRSNFVFAFLFEDTTCNTVIVNITFKETNCQPGVGGPHL